MVDQISAIVSIGGLFLPPVVDLVKKIFVKKDKDTPEATISTLATTKPEVLGEYVKACAELKRSEVEWYNRDVVGELPKWVSAWRACIRPLIVSAGIVYFMASLFTTIKLDESIVIFFGAMISAWCGERLVLKGSK
jgi:hypothetical protein